jgi:hypothetical protein
MTPLDPRYRLFPIHILPAANGVASKPVQNHVHEVLLGRQERAGATHVLFVSIDGDPASNERFRADFTRITESVRNGLLKSQTKNSP